MIRPRTQQILLVLVAGTILALLVLEGALRAPSLLRPAKTSLKGPSSLTVLCIGNSFTKGDGASPGQSYPELLEKLLNEKYPKLGATVINAGVSNATTTFLLQRLPSQLQEFKPQVVTFMVGDPNYWFNYGRNRFKEKQAPDSVITKIRWKVDEFLSSFRSVNFLKLLLQRPTTPAANLTPLQWLGEAESFNYSVELLRKKRAEKAYDSLEKHIQSHPEEVEIAISLARISFRLKEPEKLKHWLEVAQKLAPSRFLLDLYYASETKNSNLSPDLKMKFDLIHPMLKRNFPGNPLYRSLVQFHYRNFGLSFPERPANLARKDFCGYIRHLLSFRPMDINRHRALAKCLLENEKTEEALETLFSALERNPFSFHAIKLHRYIAEIQESASEIVKAKIQARKKLHPDVYQKIHHNPTNAEGSDREETNRWVKSDFKELVSLAHAKGANVIIQGYPPLRTHDFRVIDNLLPGIAQELNVPFSDTQTAIRSLQQSEAEWQSNYTNYFGPDDHHLSGKGNALVAKKLLQSLEELNWVK